MTMTMDSSPSVQNDAEEKKAYDASALRRENKGLLYREEDLYLLIFISKA